MAVIEGLEQSIEEMPRKAKPRPREAGEAVPLTRLLSFRDRYRAVASTAALVLCRHVGVAGALDSTTVGEPLPQPDGRRRRLWRNGR